MINILKAVGFTLVLFGFAYLAAYVINYVAHSKYAFYYLFGFAFVATGLCIYFELIKK